MMNRYKKYFKSIKAVEGYLNLKQKQIETYCTENNIEIKDWYFTIENRKIMREILWHIEEHSKLLLEIPITEQFWSLYRYIKLQEKARANFPIIKSNNDTDLIKKIPDLARYAKYCIGIYGHFLGRLDIKKNLRSFLTGKTNKEIFLAYSQIPEENLLFLKGSSYLYLPAHAIVAEPERKAFLVIIRGTGAAFDFISDLDSQDEIFSYKGVTGKVHSGMFKAAGRLSESLKPRLLECLAENPDYEIILIGHSLGAGCASVLTLFWLADSDLNKFQIKCFGYANPSIMSKECNQLLRGKVLSCAYGNDYITRLSFGSIIDICDALCYIYQHNSKMDIPDLYQRILEKCNNEKTYPAGDVLHIYRKDIHSDARRIVGGFDDPVLTAGFVPNDYYGTIIFASDMFTDHYATRYEKALIALVETHFK